MSIEKDSGSSLTCFGVEIGLSDRDGDSCRPASVHEFIEDLVVEEHLGCDVVRSGIDLALEVRDVLVHIRGLEMLLRIASDSDSEKALTAVLLLETAYRPHEFVGVVVTSRDRGEAFFASETVSPQGQDIGYSHKLEVL